MARILFARDGSRLGRYRLLYEVTPLVGMNAPSHKIYEFVKGAELVGNAPARSIVKAELDLTTNLGRNTVYEAVTEADASGRYRLRLGHATRGHSSALGIAETYRIRAGEVSEEIAIDEAAVLQGMRVEGPSF